MDRPCFDGPYFHMHSRMERRGRYRRQFDHLFTTRRTQILQTTNVHFGSCSEFQSRILHSLTLGPFSIHFIPLYLVPSPIRMR